MRNDPSLGDTEPRGNTKRRCDMDPRGDTDPRVIQKKQVKVERLSDAAPESDTKNACQSLTNATPERDKEEIFNSRKACRCGNRETIRKKHVKAERLTDAALERVTKEVSLSTPNFVQTNKVFSK